MMKLLVCITRRGGIREHFFISTPPFFLLPFLLVTLRVVKT
jgi:hypothetical protein